MTIDRNDLCFAGETVVEFIVQMGGMDPERHRWRGEPRREQNPRLGGSCLRQLQDPMLFDWIAGKDRQALLPTGMTGNLKINGGTDLLQ